MDTSQRDAGCDRPGGVAPNLPGTTPAPTSPTTAMTACKAAPLVQKRIA
jgi:hypothetical protein